MADTFTTAGSLTYDQTAYDLYAYKALRPELHFDAVATVKPTKQSFQGAAVVFNITSDLTAATTALDESTDVDAVAMANSQVTLTLKEYGNAVKTTRLIRATSFIPLDPEVASVVGYNAGLSIDTIARDVVKAGTNVRYAGQATSRNTVIPSDKFKATNVRRARAELKGANVMPARDGSYAGYIHPDVALDLREETGAAAWRDPHTYSQPNEIWNGEIGKFEGVIFVETPQAPVFSDAGSSTTLTDVYATLILGAEAIAKAFSTAEGLGPLPTVRPGPVTDKLWRFVPMGWYWLGAYGRFREAALRRIESSSSIGAN